MRFKKWLLQERTLYHGTIVDNEESIKQVGLVADDEPGQFVQDMYGGELPEEEMEGLVFMADKPNISAAVNAMTHHISNKLGKGFHDVTDNDVRNHGLLVVVKGIEPGDIDHRPEDDDNYYGEYPPTVEPGDYYGDQIAIDYTIKGAALVRFLRRMGVWPISSYADRSPETEKKLRGQLVALGLQAHPEQPKQAVIDRVNEVPAKELESYISQYRKTKK